MAKTREQKEETVKALTEALGDAKAIVFANYQGLGVREQQELQGNLREGGMRFAVVKNNLFTKAAKDAGLKLERPDGPVAVAYGFEDPVAVTKAVVEFSKDNEALEVTGGFVDGDPVEVSVIQKLASLPSREELLGRFVGSISAPARNFAGALSAIPRSLVYALNAVKEQKPTN
nr:Ribosomal protein L10 [uncultured bacterium]